MPINKRIKTKYPGVYYIDAMIPGTNRPDRIYYIIYRRNGKLIEEKAGRQSADDMTPARASAKRLARIEGKQLSNKAKREQEFPGWTVDRLWQEYDQFQAHRKSRAIDRCRYERHLKSRFGDIEVDQIIPLDIDRVRIKLLRSLRPQSVKHILALLGRIINFGFNKGLSPALKFRIEAPKVDNNKVDNLTPNQLRALLKAISKSTHPVAGNLMLTALYSGLRRGEMFNLKWDDIDFARGFIHLRDPKGKTDQKLPLNKATREVFESMPIRSTYVFPDRHGNKLKQANSGLTRIKIAAGLPKEFRPLHGLRHVYASMLASSGQVDMYTLQKLLTHKSPAMTQRYAHLRDDALRKASDLAGDLVDEMIQATDPIPLKKD